MFLNSEIFSGKRKSLPGVSRKGAEVPYEACRRKQKTPHDNKTDCSVLFFIRCLGSLIERCSIRSAFRLACKSMLLRLLATKCIIRLWGIIARPFVVCNRSDERFFVPGVSCRYLPTSRLPKCKYFAYSTALDGVFVESLDKKHICNSNSFLI